MRVVRASLGLLFFIIILVNFHSVFAFSKEGWEKSESKFCIVYHKTDVDIRVLSKRIDIRAIKTTSVRRTTGKGDAKQEFLEKMDTIFKKVEEVLDMFPSRISVNIKIFSTQEELNEEYEGIFNEPNNSLSFYVFKTNTIYTTKKVISESILAHEMAHCIIDHYFVILPPRKVQEILAVYADMHLFD